MSENGNGSRRSLSVRSIEGQLLPEEFTYQAKLRNALYNAIKESDVTEMAKVMIEKAKKGEPHAVAWVTDYLLGAKNKPTKVEVHNHYPDVESAARAEKALRRNGAPSTN